MSTNGFTSEGEVAPPAPEATTKGGVASAPEGKPEGKPEGGVATPEGSVAQRLRISIRGTPVSAPANWKNVKRIVKKKDFTKFTRTPETAAAYEAKAAKDLERYLTLGDQLHVEFFGALDMVDPSSGKTIAAQVAAAGQTALVLARNNFPYNLAEDVKHFVLWSRGQDFSTKEVREIVSTTLGIRKKHVRAYEQAEFLTSVPNVKHWQVFVEAKALGDAYIAGFNDAQPIRISNDALATIMAKLRKRKKIGRILLVAGLVGYASHHH